MATFDLSSSNLELLNQRLDPLGYYAVRGSNGKIYFYRIDRGAAGYDEDALRQVRNPDKLPLAITDLIANFEDKE